MTRTRRETVSRRLNEHHERTSDSGGKPDTVDPIRPDTPPYRSENSAESVRKARNPDTGERMNVHRCGECSETLYHRGASTGSSATPAGRAATSREAPDVPTPHADHGGMKVWLGADEVEAFLELVDDSTHRLAFALGLRCGLRSAEIAAVTPADLATGLAGTMLRVREDAAKGDKYRETLVLPDLL